MTQHYDPSRTSTIFTANGVSHANLNIQQGIESLTDIAKRFATAVFEKDTTFLQAVSDLNELITLMRERGDLLSPQREGLTRKQIMRTFWRLLIIKNGGVEPVESSNTQDKYSFEEAVTLLGESVFPSPESLLYNKVYKAGYIVDIKHSSDGGWDVDIVDEVYENHITVDKPYLESNFRSAKVLCKEILDQEIIQFFLPDKG